MGKMYEVVAIVVAVLLFALIMIGLSFAISTSGIEKHWQALLFLLMAVGLPAVFVYCLRKVLETPNV